MMSPMVALLSPPAYRRRRRRTRSGCLPQEGTLAAEQCGTAKQEGFIAFSSGCFSQLWQHAGEDFQPQVLLIAETVGTPLDGADLVVEALHEPQGDLVLLLAVRLNAIPVALDHAGKLLEGLQALPAQGGAPAVKEAARPSRSPVVPQLVERLLEEVGLVQPLVGLEQQAQGLLPFQGKVLPVRQQRVPLPFDKTPVRPREPGILALAYLVHRLAQVLEDMELVVQDSGLRRVPLLARGVAERLPHVHHRQANLAAFLGAQPGEELVQARLGAVRAAEPDGPAPLQVADHDAVLMPLGDGDLIDADDAGRRHASPAELFAHVLLVQLLDGVPIEEEFLGHGLDRRVATALADEEGEPLGVQRVVGGPVEPFALHPATPPTLDPAPRVGEVDPLVATREIPGTSGSLVVVGPRHLATDAARRFFRRRWRVMTTTRGSPKTPRTRGRGTKPGNR